MKQLIVLALLASFATTSFSQSDQTLFSNSGIKLTGIWGGNTSNINEDQDDYGIFHGGYVDLEFNKAFTIGWQGYGLNDQGLEMKFNGLRLAYAYESYRVVHPTVGLFVGGGRFKTKDELRLKDDVFALQPSLGLEMNIMKWFRIGVEGGYRFVFDTDIPDYSDTDVSEPYVGLRLKFGFSWGE